MGREPPHFAPRAKRCIFLFMDGGPSQLDLFDPKPKLTELKGQQLPESLLENVRFAFIKKDATLRASPRKFSRHGECGMELSDLLPHIGECADDICLIRSLHTDQFNHHPAQLIDAVRPRRAGAAGDGQLAHLRPGERIAESAGVRRADRRPRHQRRRRRCGAAVSWARTYAGVHFRTRGEAVLHLQNPPGMPRELRRAGLDAAARPESKPGTRSWAIRRSPAASPATSWRFACRPPPWS